jgi:hypothetical protein
MPALLIRTSSLDSRWRKAPAADSTEARDERSSCMRCSCADGMVALMDDIADSPFAREREVT